MTLFEAMGGTAACRELSTAFYARVARDPILRPLFPGKTFTCAIEEFAAFLVQFLGGPPEDTQRRWWLSLRESHLRFKIGARERTAWMKNMRATLDEAQIPDRARDALVSLFERSSAYVVNSGDSPVVKDGALTPELSRRWRSQLKLDEAAAAIRRGESDRVIALAEKLTGNRAVFVPLLVKMMRAGDPQMLGYVRGKLLADPALAHEGFNGRTFLHHAAGAGDVSMVEMLLQMGAAPDVLDSGDHTPLYGVANECKPPGGADVVHALIRAGANVNACGGVKHCTALHMAARRGNVEVAQALLECGADIDAKDSLGVTPLQRAMNCRKAGVAELLRSGAARRR